MPPQLPDYFSFINTPLAHTVILVLKIIFIAASAGMLGFIIWAFIKTSYVKKLFFWDFEEFFTTQPYGAKKIYGQWQKIKLRLTTGMESEYKLAVIEADSMLDDILKNMGFTGDTLGDRLASLTNETLPSINAVLESHKVRNNIVHNPDFQLTLNDAKKALEVFETALTDLRVL